MKSLFTPHPNDGRTEMEGWKDNQQQTSLMPLENLAQVFISRLNSGPLRAAGTEAALAFQSLDTVLEWETKIYKHSVPI